MAVPSAPVIAVRSTGNPTTGIAHLTWPPVAGATSYKVYNAATAAPTTPGTVVSGPSAYVTGLTLSARRYFRVKATNADGDSAYSNEVDLFPVAPTDNSSTSPSDALKHVRHLL